MNNWHGPDGEPTLADVQREFCGGECWRGTSGLFYARRCTNPRNHSYDVRGEDPRDLRDMILREKWRQAEDVWRRTGRWPDGDRHLGG